MGSKREENKHSVLKAVTLTAAAGTAAYAGFCYYIFRNAFDLEHSALSSRALIASGSSVSRDEWFARSVRDDDFIDSFDGLRLHATRITNHPQSHQWIIFVHGYHSYGLELMEYLYQADQQGYNILSIDCRGCGMSQGRFTGLGWLEHYDLIGWINYLVNLDASCQIVLYGISMGAATVMNTVGEFLPRNVRCAVEDCGYSSIREVLAAMVHSMLKVDGRPWLRGVDFYVKQMLHFSIYDVNTRRQLMQSVTPMLFVQGEKDAVVPNEMAFDCYYACSSEKELYTVENAGHAACCKNEKYFPTVFAFIKKHLQ